MGAKSASGQPRVAPPSGRARIVLDLIRATPGITIPEIASEMGVKQNFVYRVLPKLWERDMIRKYRRGWYLAESAPARAESYEETRSGANQDDDEEHGNCGDGVHAFVLRATL